MPGIFAVMILLRALRLPEPCCAFMMLGFDLWLTLRMLRESCDWFNVGGIFPIFGPPADFGISDCLIPLP